VSTIHRRPFVIRFAVLAVLIVGLFAALVPAAVAQYGASASISNVSCVLRGSNVRYTFDLTITGGMGYNFNVGVWPIERSTRQNIYSNNLGFSDINNYIHAWTSVNANFPTTVWRSVRLTIPTSAFPYGDYEFYPVFEVQTLDGYVIARHTARRCRIDTMP